jgi:hypothetical protein
LRDYTKDPRAPKYPRELTPKVSPFDSLLKNDQKTVVRLVKRYGREAVLGAVTSSPEARPRGRPSRGNLPIFEAVHLAEWFEEEEKLYRERGSAHPVLDAEISLHEMQEGRAPDHPSKKFAAWRKNMRKKRTLGNRTLKIFRQATEERARWFKDRSGRK